MFEIIKDNDNILAYIIKSNYKTDGVSFITPNEYSQQLAYMNHPKGKIIEPHIHNLVKREVHYTLEVLFIKKGKLRVDFYNDSRDYLFSKILCEGDTILLASGGHGFQVLEPIEMIEVKQGPYAGENDKIKFDGINIEEVIVK